MVLNQPNGPMTLIEDIEISTFVSHFYFLIYPIIDLEIDKTIVQAPNHNLVFDKSAV